MFKLAIILIFTLTSVILNAQNLVPNPSFEDTVACPIGGDQLFKAQYWSAFRYSPDYFHSCCNSINNSVVGVPNNAFGYQFAHSGNAYAGMTTYDLTGSPYREYLGVLLLNPLIIGNKYYLSFYLNWTGDIGFTIASNNFGAAISDSIFTPSNPFPMNNSPIAYTDSIISDSLNWTQVKLEFIASSNASYLILGNFFDDANTDTLNLGQFNQHAYYYLDDICLSTDSNYCFTYTGNDLPKMSSENIIDKYYFIENNLHLEFNDKFKHKQVEVITILGQSILKIETENSTQVIPFFQKNEVIVIKVISSNYSQIIKLIK